MGFSHYMPQKKRVTKAQWTLIEDDARKLLENSPVPFGNGQGEPTTIDELLQDEEIWLNGLGEEDSHETFLLARDSKRHSRGWDEPGEYPFIFCKTARKPYDILVCAILIVAEYHAPGCYNITSDGDESYDEWGQALEFVRMTFDDINGEIYQFPKGILREED